MSPHSSNPKSQISNLDTPIQYLKGVGPKRAEALNELGIRTVHDLLYYFPRSYLDLSRVEKVANLRRLVDTGEFVTVIGNIRRIDFLGRFPKQRLVIILADETGTVSLTFFRGVQYYKKSFEVGEALAVSGRVGAFMNRPQMIHPSIDKLEVADDEGVTLEGFLHTGGIVPKYSTTEELRNLNLESRSFRRILKAVMDEFVDSVQEFIPSGILLPYKFISLKEALRSIHFPTSYNALEDARRRLKFDELFALQMVLALRRKSVKVDLPGIGFNVQSKYARSLVDSLPFQLTKAQVRVIKEIAEDMKSNRPMNRLLQGDVGSGKTLVALVAILIAVENGYQAAFMAPTEILAEQHFKTIQTFLKDIPVNIRLLVSGQRKKLREDILEDVRRGSAQIVVGTHALIQEGVEFANLGLSVVDDQHRFGVAQRLALKEKRSTSSVSGFPDVLVMTATPIPRTLALTLYGDLDVSTLNELPTNRKPIKTVLRVEGERTSVYQFIRDQVKQGRQVYIVYPLVEESEKVDLKAATVAFEQLKKEIFSGLRVGLIHGKLPSDEKDNIMTSFKSKEIDILVATTVIEVGIDVANASVIVIEHSERFGLSQLHQLRGRVGRGAEQSYCVLIAPDWMAKVRTATQQKNILGEVEDEKLNAERRLRAMLESSDGFKIAEIDLELRGPGDFFGTRQSGMPELQLANLVSDGDLLALARHEAFKLIELDPHLRAPENMLLREHYRERFKDSLAMLQTG
ncbi:MAG: ATP-dependent DNA helicase RecG [Ignavibacteriales bacterium]|nr:ATP-dependent DNA helicase RecG [Ignavibacteriales bacterium]